MTRFTQRLLLGALVAGATIVASAPVHAAKGGTDRPFSASGNGTGIIDFPGCIGGLVLECDQTIELDFIGTHLGRSTNSSVGKIYIHLDQPCPTPAGTTGFLFESFQAVTIVAANGDELTADTTVSGCGDGVTVAYPSGEYTITGGTGRFADASGEGRIEVVSLETSLSNEWTGTISY
jgi:hypothetical protein